MLNLHCNNNDKKIKKTKKKKKKKHKKYALTEIRTQDIPRLEPRIYEFKIH